MAHGLTNGASQGQRSIQAVRRSRLIAFVILGFPTTMFALAGLRAVQLAGEGGVPAELRDLNCDGRVSWIEWLRGGIDFRLRPSTLAAGCQEIYAVKTDVPVVVRCEAEPRCRRARDLLPKDAAPAQPK